MKKVLALLCCVYGITLFASQNSLNRETSKQHGRAKGPWAVTRTYSGMDFSKQGERTVVFFEDFESGMPANWQVIDGNNDGYTWEVGTTDDLFFQPPDYGTAYAYYSDDDAGELAPAGTEYLISPAVSCSGITDLTLSYSWAFSIFDPPIGASYVRFHNGSVWSAWNQIATYYVDSCGVDIFDLTTYLPAESIQVEFTYEDPTGGWGWAFGIDNVLLEIPMDHDVGVASIDIPWYIPTDTTFCPVATVKNYGLNTESFDVTCQISPGAYSSLSTVNNLGPGEMVPVTFPNAFFFESGIYTVTVYTQLAGDENPANDTLCVDIWATDWKIYDDGMAYGSAYWFDPNNGWGVQFPVTENWWVDSIACFFDANWPSPGDTFATFKIYDGASAPTNMRYQLISTPIQRGVWNYLGIDTTQTWYLSGDNVFFFYFQVNAGPLCPALAFDYALGYPDYDWYNINGVFYAGNMWGGDWLMRIHVTNAVGINEWLPVTADDILLEMPSITRNRFTLGFTLPEATSVELSIYDAAGRKCSTLMNKKLSAGRHDSTFHLDLPSSVYFCILKTQSGINIAKKFLLIR